jgi:hypothetical protein
MTFKKACGARAINALVPERGECGGFSLKDHQSNFSEPARIIGKWTKIAPEVDAGYYLDFRDDLQVEVRWPDLLTSSGYIQDHGL